MERKVGSRGGTIKKEECRFTLLRVSEGEKRLRSFRGRFSFFGLVYAYAAT